MHDLGQKIGRLIRRRRRMLGMTQGDLARAIGVQAQQIQKYECGSNQIFASRLFDIAQALRAPIGYFYQGMAPVTDGSEGDEDVMNRQETAAFVHALAGLNPRARSAIALLAHELTGDAPSKASASPQRS